MSGLNDLALRILIGAEDRTGPAVKSTRQGIASISNQLGKLETVAKRFLDIKIFANFAQDGIKLSDTYKGLTGQLKQTEAGTRDLAGTQQNLFDIAQNTQTQLEGTVKLYARTDAALKNMAGGQEKAAKLTETVNLSFRAQASSVNEVNSTITQLTQAIATDAVQWNDFGQLADTNLMLVNVAAKNLGLDGIGALKKAMSEGRISNVQLVDAIIAGFDEIKAAADAMPLTVSAAWIEVSNAALRYVGQSGAAGAATEKLAGILHLLANNFDTIINGATILAELYSIRLAQGIAQATLNYIQNIQATREAAAVVAQETAVRRQNLQLKAQMAAITAKTNLALLDEIRVQIALAGTEEKRAAAVSRLNAAMATYKTSVATANAANASLAAGSEVAAAGISTAGKAMGLLNSAISLYIAWDIGQTVGKWLTQFELVRESGSYLAETATLIETGFKGMLDGIALPERWAQIKQIHAEYDALRDGTTKASKDSAEQIAASEKQKADAVEKETARQKAAFDKLQKSVEDLTKSIDTETKRQTELLSDQLNEQLAAIDALADDEAEKNKQRINATLQFYNDARVLQQQAAIDKLALIDRLYRDELTKSRDNEAKLHDIEQQKRAAKLAVYNGLAEAYRGQLEKITELQYSELQSANELQRSMLQLQADHEANLFQIELSGMDERRRLRTEEARFNQLLREANAELAKGEQADQDAINRKLTEARTLHGDITREAGAGSVAIYDAKQRENKIYELQKSVLENNAKQHEQNASRAKTAADAVRGSLQNVNQLIGDITKQLQDEQRLKIAVDPGSLAAARSAIAQLTKPETKIITIITRFAGQAAQTGGLIHQFAAGGYTPLSGKLPGYGGGDKVRALLEAGEFIMRKEAVRQFGLPFFESVNAGRLPEPIRRAEGGSTTAPPRKNKQVLTPDTGAGTGEMSLKDLMKELGRLLLQQKHLRQLLKELNRTFVPGAPYYINRNYYQKVQQLAFREAQLNKQINGIMSQITATGNRVNVLYDPGIKEGFTTTTSSDKPSINVLLNGNLFSKFGLGGLVPGFGSGDTVPAMLTPGEFVMRKTAVAALGPDFMQMLNNGMLPVQRFAEGGLAAPHFGNSIGQQIQSGFNDLSNLLAKIRDQNIEAINNRPSASVTITGPKGDVGNFSGSRQDVDRLIDLLESYDDRSLR